MSSLSKKLRLLALTIGAVLVWRGIWGISDLYLFPNHELSSFIASLVVGALILFFDSNKISRLI